MANAINPFVLITSFEEYSVTEIIGEGGSGRVFGATAGDGTPVAIKMISSVTASADKRRRFRNEVAFQLKNTHANIVRVIDHGIGTGKGQGPFCVMPRYSGSLRDLISGGIGHHDVMSKIGMVLDGVEAAHMRNVTHRDLKPENILFDEKSSRLAIADFGIARFTQAELETLVETKPTQRLANFEYAAPEQRRKGQQVDARADIYALGLIINEMFTRRTPIGSSYRLVNDEAPQFGYLDPIVAAMISQSPNDRPDSIGSVKSLIRRYEQQYISRQRLDELSDEVVNEYKITDMLAYHPPVLTSFDWDNGTLKLYLDRPVTDGWVRVFRGSNWPHTSVSNIPPQVFNFTGDRVRIGTTVSPNAVQSVINFFKSWLPTVTSHYQMVLKQEMASKEAEERQRLRLERARVEARVQVLQNVKI